GQYRAPREPVHMSEFDDRERAEERKFQLDQELEFKAAARRNKMLGLWAAEQMGLTGPAAETYAQDVISADMSAKGDEDVFAKLRKDLDAKGVAISDHMIRAYMSDFLDKARAQVRAGN